DQDVYNAAGS
ncbi:hypothetical protein PF007_g27296, partial [Phytophthora fragariae]